jgi:hypothetical protein
VLSAGLRDAGLQGSDGRPSLDGDLDFGDGAGSAAWSRFLEVCALSRPPAPSPDDALLHARLGLVESLHGDNLRQRAAGSGSVRVRPPMAPAGAPALAPPGFVCGRLGPAVEKRVRRGARHGAGERWGSPV